MRGQSDGTANLFWTTEVFWVRLHGDGAFTRDSGGLSGCNA